MKNITLIFIMLMSYSAIAQDIIKLKNGEEIHAKAITTTALDVKYKYYYIDGSEVFSTPKKDVSYIQYQNGAKETFDQPAQTAGSSTTNYAPANDNKSNDALVKQMEKQNAALVDALMGLKDNMADLKTAIEKGNEESKKQNQQLLDKITELNTVINKVQTSATTDEKKEIDARAFGFGINLITSINLLDTAYRKFVAGAGINAIFTMGLQKKVRFRIEPFFDFSGSSNTSGSNENKTTTKNSYLNIGSRLSLLIQRKKVNIYLGPSLSYFDGITTVKADNQTIKNNQPGLCFGIHIGGEYMIASNFSVCMETGFQSISAFKSDIGNSTSVVAPFGRLGGRFYF